MRSRLQGVIEGGAHEIISMAYIKKALPISDQDFMETYISDLKKPTFLHKAVASWMIQLSGPVGFKVN